MAQPKRDLEKGPEVFWCLSGKKIFVKNSWGGALKQGVQPGMEVVQVDGVPARKWLVRRVAELSDATGAQLFHGVREQSYIYHAIVAAWGWTDGTDPAQETPR